VSLNFWPIYKRELRTISHSSSTYIALGLFFLVSGAVYHSIMVGFVHDTVASKASPVADAPQNINLAVIQQTFRTIAGMILFTIPILSMRLIAEERSTGTFEVLMVCPIGDWSILLGKYFAQVTLGLIVVLLCSIYPITTYFLGRAQGAIPDVSIVIACYLGLFFIFSTYSAFGLMTSSLTRSQATAAILALIGLLLWNMLGDMPASNPFIQDIIHELSPMRHTDNFTSGFFSSKDLAFYGLTSCLFLFVAARALESRRWRI